MIGQILGHYCILEHIGAGGMGVVYRAHDEQLDRDVALKVLPAGMLADEATRKRFRKEALALAKLNHPNIETVYEFATQEGVDFLAMELIPGVSLDAKLAAGALPEQEVLRLGAQVAMGLEAAHRNGIVHRDLKPANLRLNSDGQLKILDFGLAQLVQPESDTALVGTLTEPQQVTGTLPYMAPEQLRGEAPDVRSDIWAAGAVLYEMASGKRPFRESNGPLLINSILNQEPEPPSKTNRQVSPGLENIILKALDKNPKLRYQTAREMGVDLERLNAPAVVPPRHRALNVHWGRRAIVVACLALVAAVVGWRVLRSSKPTIDSLAILPFESTADDPGSNYLSDGFTQHIINSVSEVPGVKVIAHTSVFRYKGQNRDALQIGRDLNVGAVLTGRLTRQDSRVLVSAELVDARDSRHLWGEQYNRSSADLLGIEQDIAAAVVKRLGLPLMTEEKDRLSRRPTQNAEAYEAYLRGTYFANRLTSEANRRSIEYFQRAITLDPNYAAAYAGLASAYALGSVGGGGIAPAEGMPAASVAVHHALSLDGNLGQAHFVLGLIRFLYDRDMEGAGREFQRATELNPTFSEGHHWYSHYWMTMGESERSLAESRRALELDPLSPDINWHLAWHYRMAHQPKKALEVLQSALELDPNSPQAHIHYSLALEDLGRLSDAIAELQKVRATALESPFGMSELAHALAISGRHAEALKQLAELQQLAKQRYVDPFGIAMVYIGLGDKDQAFASLDRAYDEHSYGLVSYFRDPRLDPLRSDPRFVQLGHRIGLAKPLTTPPTGQSLQRYIQQLS